MFISFSYVNLSLLVMIIICVVTNFEEERLPLRTENI